MKKQNRLSAVIITFNEERNIARCLDSLKGIADEIIVVDSFSTDKTEEICSQRDVKFVQNAFEGYLEQKNFATNLASNDYVLSLDADESLDEKIKQSILKEKKIFKYDVYLFSRMTNYCGKWIKHCGWYPDKKHRMWNKSKARWGGKSVHETLVIDKRASVKQLKGDILHYSFYTVLDHVKQIQKFTDLSSRDAYEGGKKTNMMALLFKPSFKFFRDYILKAGFLDGYYGFIICINSAYAKFLKYMKLYELQRGKLT